MASTWGYWTDDGTGSATTASVVWDNWTTSTMTTSASTDTWTTWTCDTTTGSVTTAYIPWMQWNIVYEETVEQIAQREAQAAEYARQQAERQLKLAQAEKRAEQLLVDALTPEQERAWKEEKAFFVKGGTTGKRYKVKHGRNGNIREVDDQGKEIASLCVNVPYELPQQDNVLAQKLMLEFNEEALLRIANRSQIRA